MSYYPDDPNYRRELQREIDQEGVSAAAWTGIGVALLLFAGVMVYAFMTDPAARMASGNQPATEQSMPPATTGQGGAQSRMPAKNAQ